MRTRSLFISMLVIGSVVVPYLLSDDKFMWQVGNILGREQGEFIPNQTYPSKPTTAGKPSAPAFSKPNDTGWNQDRSIFGTVPTGNYDSAYLDSAYLTAPPNGFAAGTKSSTTAQVALIDSPVGRPVMLPSPTGPPNTPLEHLLSFEVTPDWIKKNWSQVSLRAGEMDLQGWRVPLAQGNQPGDFAGSLTYYFDRQRRLQRILLHGYLGDPRQLIELAQQRFGMRRQLIASRELYSATVDAQTVGAMQVKVPRSVQPNGRAPRTEVLMELNRKATAYGMSYEFQQILQRAAEDERLIEYPNRQPDERGSEPIGLRDGA